MRIFISYAWEDIEVAEGLATALRAEGHRVFLDRSQGKGRGLAAGDPIEKTIREQIWGSHLFLFLVSPDSLRQGSYAKAELRIAQNEWAADEGRILPVMVRQTEGDLPASLRVSVLQPEGNLIPETCAAIASRVRARRRRRRRLLAAVAVVLILTLSVVSFYLLRPPPDRYAHLKTASATREAEDFFKRSVTGMGFSDVEVVDTWFGDFMINQRMELAKLAAFLQLKAQRGERGDLLIGVWHPPAGDDPNPTWFIYTGLADADLRPTALSSQQVIHSPGVEPRDGAARVNNGGLSATGWGLVLGTYTRSYDEGTAEWLCYNFAPQRPPIYDTRPPLQMTRLAAVDGGRRCPPQKFQMPTDSQLPEFETFRAMLNLQGAPTETRKRDTIVISVTKNESPKALPARVSLLWAKAKD